MHVRICYMHLPRTSMSSQDILLTALPVAMDKLHLVCRKLCLALHILHKHRGCPAAGLADST